MIHECLPANGAFIDVDRHPPRQLLFWVERRIGRRRIDALARPAIEDLVKILHGGSLDGNTGFVCRLDQPAHDRDQPARECFAVLRKTARLEIVDEQPNVACQREQAMLELRHRCLGKRNVLRLQRMETERFVAARLPLSAVCRRGGSDVAERHAAAPCDRRQIPKDVTKLFRDGVSVTQVGGIVALLFLGLTEQAADFAEKAKHREAQCAATAALISPRGLLRIIRNSESFEILAHRLPFRRSDIASAGTLTP